MPSTSHLLLALSLALPACGRKSDTGRDAPGGPYAGSFDDLPVDDHDMQGLKLLLNDKWTYFLYEMDKYSIVRDSSTNDEMLDHMAYVFADEFVFHAYNNDGSEFGNTRGTFTPRSWLEHQDIDKWNLLHQHSTMVVPNYGHVLHTVESGERMVLQGYHEHAFIGEELRVAMGAARQLAFETIVYEKVDGVWRVTEYEEVVFDATELGP